MNATHSERDMNPRLGVLLFIRGNLPMLYPGEQGDAARHGPEDEQKSAVRDHLID